MDFVDGVRIADFEAEEQDYGSVMAIRVFDRASSAGGWTFQGFSGVR
jgi:hypothetical protein